MICRRQYVINGYVTKSCSKREGSGNGFDEIGIATERGNVYLKEYMDPSEGAMSIPPKNSNLEWTTNTQTYGDPYTLATADLDGDGIDEIICASVFDASPRVLPNL